MNYATLNECRVYLGLAATETADDALLSDLIVGANATINDIALRRFDPVIEARKFDYDRPLYLLFGDDLLTLTSITNGNGTTILPAAVALESPRLYPKYAIRILNSAGISFTYTTDPQECITVTGTWGYHGDWPNAFVDSLDDVGGGGINASVTAITVTSCAGSAVDGRSPRFQAGQLVRVDSEYMTVVSAVTTTLTVARAANGSTAAVHSAGASIYVYRPPETIRQACLRIVAWRYRQKDANTFEQVSVFGTTTSIVPGNVPPDISALIPERIAFP